MILNAPHVAMFVTILNFSSIHFIFPSSMYIAARECDPHRLIVSQISQKPRSAQHGVQRLGWKLRGIQGPGGFRELLSNRW